MCKETLKKGHFCNVCTGCGRCEKNASSMQVLDFYGVKCENQLKNSELACKYIVTVDIGTTTIAMLLQKLDTGKVIDSYKSVNPQRKYGADVLSRIMAADDLEKKKDMKESVFQVLREGILKFQSKCPQIELIVIAANTTMVHLALGFDVSKMGEAPFEAENLEEINMEFEGIPMIIMPGFDTFVGGDVLSGIYSLKMEQKEEIALYIDLGTNGEIALGNKEKILATATAAAPAFEGGCNDNIWSSDLVKVTAELLKYKILDETGLLEDPYFDEGIRCEGAMITQNLIRNIQMAKGAIFAGIEILCKQYGINDYSEIDQVILAGGLGYYLNAKAAVRIGLIPYKLSEKVTAIGNGALAGAFLYGRNRLDNCVNQKYFMKIKERVTVINLAKQPEFQNLYLKALNFPAEL